MAKLVLDMEAMQDNFFADAAMIGIASAMPAYHLCWALNERLELAFVRDPAQNISLKKKNNKFNYPTYRFDLPNSSHTYLLYKLKDGAESLLPETRHLDYLIFIQTGDPEEDAYRLVTELKTIHDIQLAQVLDPEDMKNLANLLV
jgi:hypothetical protein